MNIDETLSKWYEAKEKMEILKDKIEKYRNIILYEMEKQGISKLDNKEYSVCRRKMSRSYVSKDTLPSDIWKKYACHVKYDTFTIKKKK